MSDYDVKRGCTVRRKETYFPDAIILNEEMASWVMPRGE